MKTARPRFRAACSIARIVREKNGSEMSGTAMPIAESRPERKVRASALGM